MRSKGEEKFTSEVELASAVCLWLESQGYEVFKEVFTYDGEIDIVARCPQSQMLWGIECKLRMSNEVCEQAHKRLLSVHKVSVAAQLRGYDEIAPVQEFWLDHFGIGVISVMKSNGYRRFPPQTVLIEEVKKPRLLRPHDLGGIHSPRKYWPESQRPNRVKLTEGIKRTRSFLMKATQETTAGAPGGGQFTPWKRTVVLLKEFLKKKGKATVKEILAEIDHHYRSGSSARDGITRIMGTFEKQHFKMTRDGKEIYWELTDPESVTDKSSSRDPRTYVYSEDD